MIKYFSLALVLFITAFSSFGQDFSEEESSFIEACKIGDFESAEKHVDKISLWLLSKGLKLAKENGHGEFCEKMGKLDQLALPADPHELFLDPNSARDLVMTTKGKFSHE